jgi:NAD-dependent dihydropyrimidine dehydrogenase PreA subunit
MATNYRQRILDEVRKLKEETPCADCEENHPYYVIQFDHRPGTQKIDKINRLIWRASRKTIFEEIAKCDIVCGNCHAKRTYHRQMNYVTI